MHRAENHALCLARGLNIPPASESVSPSASPSAEELGAHWESVANHARAALRQFLGSTRALDSSEALAALDGVAGETLRTIARVLDLYAQHAPSPGPQVARARNLWAACAFGASGNGPSALVAIRRAFPTLRPRTGAYAALLLACAPSLAHQARAHLARFAGGEAACDALQAFLSDGASELMPGVTATWEALLAGDMPQDGNVAQDGHPPQDGDVPLPLARLCVQQTLRLSTARALRRSPIARSDAQRLVAAFPVLLPPQWNALQCGLLHEPANAVVSLRPSTGKTLLGELCALAALPADGLVVFIAPYIALGRQTAAALEAHLPATVRVHRLLGGHDAPHANFARGRHIAVATPERLDALLRWQPATRARLRAVICDEAHLIADGARGVRLEGVLTRLRLWQGQDAPSDGEQLIASAPRLVLLSAATGEAQELSEWLDAPQSLRIRDQWAPTARRVALWSADGQLAWHDPTDGALIGSDKVTWPHPVRATESWPQIQRNEPRTRANVAHLARHLYETQGGAVLCVSATREGARQLAFAMAQAWPQGAAPRGARAQAMALIAERYAFLEPLRACLAKGVAWHNGTLPYPVRALLEDAVREGELGAVASTTTLAEGVDLPFRWTLLADWLHWGGEAPKPQLRPMSRALWRNIAGRCGRAGIYTEGDTLLFDNPLGPLEFTDPTVRPTWHHIYLSGTEPAAPASALEGIEDALSSTEVRDAWAAQVLAAVAENPDLPGLPDVLCRTSYAAHRAESVSALHALTQTMCQDLLQDEFAQRGLGGGLVLTPLGAAANTTGFSPAACRRLVAALRELRGPRNLFDAWGAGDEVASTNRIAREVSALLLSTCDIASAPDTLRRLTRGRSRAPLKPADMPRVLEGWLQGVAPEDLFASLPGGHDLSAIVEEIVSQNQAEPSPGAASTHGDTPAPIARIPGFDLFADWLRATIENWAPWLCRAAATLEPFARPEGTTAWPWAQWAAWCEAGVESDWVLEALRRGAPGGRRALALLGQHWPAAWAGDFDPLGLIPLRTAAGHAEFETLVRDCVRVAGGRYSPDGKSVLLAREWLATHATGNDSNTHQENLSFPQLHPSNVSEREVDSETCRISATPYFRVREQNG